MKPYHILVLFIAFLLISCKSNPESDNKNVLNQLIKKYPDLYGHGLIERYKLVRSFYNNVDSIKMELLETEHSEQQIAILSRVNGQIYAIPFPDNDHRVYWGFYDEHLTSHTFDNTFNGELQKAYSKLSITDKWSKVKVFNDLLVSLIQAKPVFPADSIAIKSYLKASFFADSCIVFSKNNFKSLFYYNELSIDDFSTFHDFRHNRYFQIGNMNNHEKNLQISIFRQPCIVKPLYL